MRQRFQRGHQDSGVLLAVRRAGATRHRRLGQLHGTNDVGWSRIGLLFPIRLVFDESASRTAYWLSLLWFTGLAVLLLRDRKPLKTYVASEAILLPGSALVLFLGRSSMTDVVAKTVFYVFESALPLTWAVRLLWLEYRVRRSRPRPIPVSRHVFVARERLPAYVRHRVLFRFKRFGGLLGRVDFSRFDDGKFGHIKGPANDLTIQVLFALHPRLGLWIFSGVVNDVLQLGGQLSSLGLFGTSFLLGLAFAIFPIRGYQPLKTYLTFETLCGLPNGLLLLCGVLWSIGNGQLAISSWAWLAAVLVLLFISVVPCVWAIRLLRFGRRQARAGVGTS